MKGKYSGQDVERVLQMYQTTLLSTREVARRCGVGRQSAHDWIKASGISRTRNASREYAPGARRKVRELYNSGMTCNQVASRTGIHVSTVKRWMRKDGLIRSISAGTTLGQTKYDMDTVARVASLRANGASYKQVSALTGVPIGSIYALVKRFDERMRKQRRNDYKFREWNHADTAIDELQLVAE